MKKYTQPTAKVVELSVKESLSLTTPVSTERTFGFGSYSKTAKVTTFAAKGVSQIKVQTNG
jgi:hypothetical protein